MRLIIFSMKEVIERGLFVNYFCLHVAPFPKIPSDVEIIA